MVGRPGIGKGSAINPVTSIIAESKTCNTLSDRITIEFILERMSKGWPTHGQNKIGIDSSCLITSPELSVFISASQNTLPILADLWDAREGEFVYGTRHKGEFRIKNPCVTLLGGSTQEWLISSIPANAVGGGFTRRVNFVVANDRERLLPWPVLSSAPDLRDRLVHDLVEVSNLNGEMTFSVNARPLFEKCYKESEPDVYDDEATTSYKTSRWAQVTKLAMCMSASRGDDLLITEADFKKAYDAVMTVSKNVQRVFRGVGESELIVVTDKLLKFLEIKGFASKREIMHSLWRDVTSEDIDKVLVTLKEANIIYDYVQGHNTMYAVVDNGVASKGSKGLKPKGVVP